MHILIAQNPHTYAVIIRIESVSGYYPHQQNRVRMPVVKSTWTLTPVGEGLVEVMFQGFGEPGGNLSSPFFRRFYNPASWEAPLNTLAGLRARINGGNAGDCREQSLPASPYLVRPWTRRLGHLSAMDGSNPDKTIEFNTFMASL